MTLQHKVVGAPFFDLVGRDSSLIVAGLGLLFIRPCPRPE
jgi:hypothetical protein